MNKSIEEIQHQIYFKTLSNAWLGDQVWDQVTSKVQAQVSSLVQTQIQYQIWDQMYFLMRSQMRGQANQSIQSHNENLSINPKF